jgi:membrane-associated phospholipid phosphatase
VTVGRAARWLLLACTLFGLAAMHTLGHAGMRMAADHHGVQVAAGPVTMGLADAVGAHCPDGHCDGAMSGWSVCLAVLGGLAVIVLLAILLSWAASRRRVRLHLVAVSAAPRAPPRRTAGLTTASVAVLRM